MTHAGQPASDPDPDPRLLPEPEPPGSPLPEPVLLPDPELSSPPDPDPPSELVGLRLPREVAESWAPESVDVFLPFELVQAVATETPQRRTRRSEVDGSGLFVIEHLPLL